MSLVPKYVLSESIGALFDPADLRVRESHQVLVPFQGLHADRVCNEQHVRLRIAGGEFGRELAEDVARSGSIDLHVNVRIGLLESLHRLGGVMIRLRRVEIERRGVRRRREQCHGDGRTANYLSDVHDGSSTCFSSRAISCRAPPSLERSRTCFRSNKLPKEICSFVFCQRQLFRFWIRVPLDEAGRGTAPSTE